MPKPWICTDEQSGASIMLAAGTEAGELVIEAHDPADGALVRVTADARQLVRAACERADGTPAPVVLPRRRVPQSGTCRTAIGVLTARPGSGCDHLHPAAAARPALTPRQALESAAALASCATAVEEGPDPRQVQAIAGTISALLADGTAGPEEMARAILRDCAIPRPRQAADPAS